MKWSDAASWSTAALFVLMIAGYPLVALIPAFTSIDSRMVSVPYRGLFLVLALVVIAVAGFRQGRLHCGLFWVLLGGFWLFYGTRIVMDTIYGAAPLRLSGVEYLAYGFGMTLISMVAFMVQATDRTLDRARVGTLLASSIACCLIIGVAATRLLSEGGSAWVGRLGIPTFNPIALGHLGASVILVAVHGLLEAGNDVRMARMVVVVALVVGLVTVAAAASRGPLIALAFTMPPLLVVGFMRGARLRAPALAALLLVGGGLLSVTLERRFGISILYRLMATAGSGTDWAPDVRIQLVGRAWQQFLEQPITGSGLEERISQYYPHNVIVESFMATGIAGGTIFVLLVLTSLFGALRLLLFDRRHGWVALLFMQYLLGAQFSGALYSNVTMWCLMAAVIAREGTMDTERSHRAFVPQPRTAPTG